MMTATIPAHTLQRIGVSKLSSYEVTSKDIKRFAQAIDEPNHSYYELNHSESGESHLFIAPPLFCQSFAFEDAPLSDLSADGSPSELNIDLPALRTVGGGSVYEIHEDVRSGDKITVRSQVNDLYTKEGKSGLLFFIIVETTFYNQHGTLVAKETATFIKR